VLPAKREACAATASADLQNSVGNGTELRKNGTISFYTWSVQDPNGQKVGPNDQVTVRLVTGGVPSNDPPAASDSTNRIQVPKQGEKGTFLSYGGPTVALTRQDKSLMIAAPDTETLTSTSDKYIGHAYAQARAPGFGQSFGALTNKLWNGQSPAPPPGQAAAAAYDPFTIPGGQSYDYPLVIDATLDSDADSTVGALYYALDSKTYTSGILDDFQQDTPPMSQTLYWLGIAAGSGTIQSSSDIQISFELNPLALNEITFPSPWLATIPGYSGSLTAQARADLIEQQIESEMRQPGVFAIGGGSATLSGYSVFPDGTSFTPDGGSVEYADGVNAGINSVPEPSTVGLLGVGALGIMRCCRRSRPALLDGEMVGVRGHSEEVVGPADTGAAVSHPREAQCAVHRQKAQRAVGGAGRALGSRLWPLMSTIRTYAFEQPSHLLILVVTRTNNRPLLQQLDNMP
jgi:hypothetical protein